jgi:hypothetical protein
MVRTVITPENTNIMLSIPDTYVGKRIEVTFLALDELMQQPQKTLGDFWGALSKEEGLLLKEYTQHAREEWNRDF